MRLPIDLKNIPTQHEADVRRAIQLESYGVVFGFITVLILICS